MISANIKNTSVQLAGHPSQQVRLISAMTDADKAAILDSDILNAKLTMNLINGTSPNGVEYTATEKSKLAGIATGATNTPISNTLTSTSEVHALSAAQGKILKDAIDALMARVSGLEG